MDKPKEGIDWIAAHWGHPSGRSPTSACSLRSCVMCCVLRTQCAMKFAQRCVILVCVFCMLPPHLLLFFIYCFLHFLYNLNDLDLLVNAPSALLRLSLLFFSLPFYSFNILPCKVCVWTLLLTSTMELSSLHRQTHSF